MIAKAVLPVKGLSFHIAATGENTPVDDEQEDKSVHAMAYCLLSSLPMSYLRELMEVMNDTMAYRKVLLEAGNTEHHELISERLGKIREKAGDFIQ